MQMFVVVWQYDVALENREEFCRVYGKSGFWVRLFQSSPDYITSELLANNKGFLLLDKWTSKMAYEEFLNNNLERYSKASKEFEHLYLNEKKVGDYEMIK